MQKFFRFQKFQLAAAAGESSRFSAMQHFTILETEYLKFKTVMTFSSHFIKRFCK